MKPPRLVLFHLVRLSVLCTSSVVQAASASADPNGDSPDPQVIGGKDVPEGKYPFMASLQLKDKHICGASVLTETALLTAAHCVQQSASSLQVLIGTANLKSKGDKYKVASIKVHPGFKQSGRGVVNDIAVLKLASNISFGDGKKVAQVCLPKLADAPEPSKCRVIGWGQTSGGIVGSILGRPDKLQEGTMPIIARDKCTKKFPIPESVLCTGQSMSGGSTSACFGDSGGPLACPLAGAKNDSGGALLLYGLTSYGTSTACKDGPVFFTRVASFIDWIKKNAE